MLQKLECPSQVRTARPAINPRYISFCRAVNVAIEDLCRRQRDHVFSWPTEVVWIRYCSKPLRSKWVLLEHCGILSRGTSGIWTEARFRFTAWEARGSTDKRKKSIEPQEIKSLRHEVIVRRQFISSCPLELLRLLEHKDVIRCGVDGPWKVRYPNKHPAFEWQLPGLIIPV